MPGPHMVKKAGPFGIQRLREWNGSQWLKENSRRGFRAIDSVSRSAPIRLTLVPLSAMIQCSKCYGLR